MSPQEVVLVLQSEYILEEYCYKCIEHSSDNVITLPFVFCTDNEAFVDEINNNAVVTNVV